MAMRDRHRARRGKRLPVLGGSAMTTASRSLLVAVESRMRCEELSLLSFVADDSLTIPLRRFEATPSASSLVPPRGSSSTTSLSAWKSASLKRESINEASSAMEVMELESAVVSIPFSAWRHVWQLPKRGRAIRRRIVCFIFSLSELFIFSLSELFTNLVAYIELESEHAAGIDETLSEEPQYGVVYLAFGRSKEPHKRHDHSCQQQAHGGNVVYDFLHDDCSVTCFLCQMGSIPFFTYFWLKIRYSNG